MLNQAGGQAAGGATAAATAVAGWPSQAKGFLMAQTAAELAKDLAVAAIQAQPAVVAPRAPGQGGDAAALGQEAAIVFITILNAIAPKVPRA